MHEYDESLIENSWESNAIFAGMIHIIPKPESLNTFDLVAPAPDTGYDPLIAAIQ